MEVASLAVILSCLAASGSAQPDSPPDPGRILDRFLAERMEEYVKRGLDRLESGEMEEMEFPHGITIKVDSAFLENITTLYREGEVIVKPGNVLGSTVFEIPLTLEVLRAGVNISYKFGYISSNKKIRVSVLRVSFVLQVSTLLDNSTDSCAGNVDALSFSELNGYQVSFGRSLIEQMESGFLTWALNVSHDFIRRTLNVAIMELQMQYGVYLPTQGELICQLLQNFSYQSKK